MSSLEAFRPEAYINFSLEAFGREAPKASFWTPPPHPPTPEKTIENPRAPVAAGMSSLEAFGPEATLILHLKLLDE